MSRHLSYLSPERNLEHETLIDMPKRVPASQWLEKQFGQPWHPWTILKDDGPWPGQVVTATLRT